MGLSRRVPAWVWIVGLLVSMPAWALLLGRVGGSDDDDDPARPSEAIGSGTTTTTQATTSIATLPPSTTMPATTPPPPSAIPGLTVDNLQGNLAGQGWDCGPAADQPHPGHTVTACREPAGGSILQAIATPTGEVVFVEVVALTASEYRWLEHVAALPWDGAEPETARSWVQLMTSGAAGALGLDLYTNRFGGVRYEMSGLPGATMTLALGAEPAT